MFAMHNSFAPFCFVCKVLTFPMYVASLYLAPVYHVICFASFFTSKIRCLFVGCLMRIQVGIPKDYQWRWTFEMISATDKPNTFTPFDVFSLLSPDKISCASSYQCLEATQTSRYKDSPCPRRVLFQAICRCISRVFGQWSVYGGGGTFSLSFFCFRFSKCLFPITHTYYLFVV